MTSMLDKESAEFPGISKNQRLHLEDDAMAQLVRFKVDDKTAVANYLSGKLFLLFPRPEAQPHSRQE